MTRGADLERKIGWGDVRFLVVAGQEPAGTAHALPEYDASARLGNALDYGTSAL